MRLALAVVALASSLILVAWRQARALEALAALDAVREERLLAQAERADLERRIEFLRSRAYIEPAARTRLRMHVAGTSEIRILPGDIL